ncbi:thiamine pyrophosphate-binding protein [Temperatibacter marinus]|uniref:Thiamine pyrophosphate-binding protein n=1 Tax=Temperatibacter marinus TaxID=1456591 RepID=A0AA52EEK9_9PROT|nr:thiamine pyrophosphate-binding protein [Temperatibacter marinus]WND01653.1 thiamine pyrophosphate-binding protein [Temperatibacter marinus]
MGEQITGGEALIQALLDNGADMAFGVPGESYLAALDALHAKEDSLPFITCRHEAGAANMAEAYGKMTGKPGLCFVTRGPGATHATIGLHTAFQDSTPMIMLIGQVASDQRDREAFQEVNYTHFLSEVTKWTAEIHDADRIAEYIGRAYRVATSGRPGPVALALPEDMLTSLTTAQKSIPFMPSKPAPSETDLAAFSELLENAERPLLMVGGSGWTDESCAALLAFAENNSMPVCASFRCADRMNNDHPNYMGDMGIGANPSLIAQMEEADVLIVLGARLGEMTTGGYSRLNPPVLDKTLIHIHAGAEEIGRVYQPDLGINATPTTFLRALKDSRFKHAEKWQTLVTEGRHSYEKWNEPVACEGDVQVADLYSHMKNTLPEDSIFCNGAGNYAAWLHRFWRYRKFPSELAPTSGAMGYGVPAAIAAKLIAPERTVLCAAGDGCFMMSVQELATAVRYKANVIFLVFNNSMLGTIRMHQENTYPDRISGTDLTNPDFVALAKSFGMQAWRVSKTEDFNLILTAAQTVDCPSLIEITVDPRAIAPGKNYTKL